MSKSYSKIRHIQEANRLLEERLIIEGLKSVLNEAVLPIIQEGDDLCDILCGKKQAKYGSNGIVVKQIQHALNNCGFNVEKQGGGINDACKKSVEDCDGLFRKETKKAVEDFQKANGLTVDGAVGYRTLTRMGGECIELPKCDCKDKDTDNDNNNNNNNKLDWWNRIDSEIPNKDCDTINGCLYITFDECGKTNDSKCFHDTFLRCMKKGGPEQYRNEKCGDCPDYINRMPGIGQKPPSEFEEGCIKSGCSKVVY